MDAEGAPIMRHLIAFDTLISDQQTECFWTLLKVSLALRDTGIL